LFKQEYKRLKFSISKAAYDELIQALRNHNYALTQLTKQSLELGPARAKAKACAYPDFKVFQKYAQGLYETLRSSLRCTGVCQGHAVKLRLEIRDKKLEIEGNIPEDTAFRVVFTHASKSQWREADVKHMLDSTRAVPVPSTSNTPVSSSVGNRKSVRFEQASTQSHSQHTLRRSTTTIVRQPVVLPSGTTSPHIRDICQAVQRLQHPRASVCVGYFLDTMQRKHGVFSTFSCGIYSQQLWKACTLREVLSDPTSTGLELTQRDKLRIAVDLASSTLQLYNTPWLGEGWNDNDVYFVGKAGASSSDMLKYSYVHRHLGSRQLSTTSQAQHARQRVIRNETLYSLGVRLIELWYGKTITDLQKPSDSDCQNTPGIAWCTAERIVDEKLEFDAGTRYTDAVRRCLRCDFGCKDTNLEEKDFQQVVYEGVVIPLETTLSQHSGQWS
jgi:hypothetical protein